MENPVSAMKSLAFYNFLLQLSQVVLRTNASGKEQKNKKQIKSKYVSTPFFSFNHLEFNFIWMAKNAED